MIKKSLKLKIAISGFLILVLLFPQIVSAWARHNLMTYAAIRNIPWLKKLPSCPVTENKYLDESLNPDFFPVYINSDPNQRLIVPPKFIYHDLNSDLRYGYQGGEIGEKCPPLQILADYSDEPDWGMDKNLNLALSQHLMGGSQGYRHMYYSAFTFHLPWMFLPQGVAPERLEHFYQMAKNAFANNDRYWGFRFLARSLHFIQDLAQPYHTAQLCFKFFNWRSPFTHAVETTKNYHFAYESLIARILELEAGKKLPADYHQILISTPAIKAENIDDLVKSIVRQSRNLSAEAFGTSIAIFGEKMKAKEPVKLTTEDVHYILNLPGSDVRRVAFERNARAALSVVAGGTKGLLELANRDLPIGKGK
ncbi:MAG: hypothetical protein HZA78_01535 [Candidatus Schekmanbacteria bacterium]|nr:hypothetical protein [Candidatus Schekmanbacteria bacterium]